MKRFLKAGIIGAALAGGLWLYFGRLRPVDSYAFSTGTEGWEAKRGHKGDQPLLWSGRGGDPGGHVVSSGEWWVDANHGQEIYATPGGGIGKVEKAGATWTGDLHMVCMTAAECYFPSPWFRLRGYLHKRVDDTLIPLLGRARRSVAPPGPSPSRAVVHDSPRVRPSGFVKATLSHILYTLPAPRLDFRGAVVRGSVRGSGVDLRGASLVFWFQGFDRPTGKFVNVALVGAPLDRLVTSGGWRHFELPLRDDPSLWKCMGASTFNETTYGAAPVGRVLGDVNHSFGFILYPLRDRHPDGSLDLTNLPAGRIEFDTIEVRSRPDFTEPLLLAASAPALALAACYALTALRGAKKPRVPAPAGGPPGA